MRWLFWWRPPALLRRVIVNFRHSESEAVEGILWQARGSWLILRDATAIKSERPPAKMVGEAHIERANVSYVQVLP